MKLEQLLSEDQREQLLNLRTIAKRAKRIDEVKDDTINKIAAMAKGETLLTLGTELKKEFGNKNVEFISMDMIPVHFRVKVGNKTVVVISKKYADSPDAVVGDIAIGYA